MRAAIRGDFERLEQRLGAQELMHVRDPEPESPVEAVESSAEPARPSWLERLLASIPPRQV